MTRLARLLPLLLLVGVFLISVQAVAGEVAGQAPPAGAASIPYKKDQVLTTATMVKVFGAGAVLLAMAAGVLYLMKRTMLGGLQPLAGASLPIQILAAKRLNPRTLLYVVEINQRTITLAQTGDRVTLLDNQPSRRGNGVEDNKNNGN